MTTAKTATSKTATFDELLLKMRNATAWVELATATGNRELQQFGEWQRDHAQEAALAQREFEAAEKALLAQLNPTPQPAEDRP